MELKRMHAKEGRRAMARCKCFAVGQDGSVLGAASLVLTI